MSKPLRYNQFKDRIDIDELERALGFEVIHQDGDNDIGYCLFPENHEHGDTSGKFAIHRTKACYNCWVCDGGSLLSLAMEYWHLDVDEATERLYEFVGENDQTDGEFHDYLLALLEDVEERVDTLPYFNERVLERYNGPTDYFHTRGISAEEIDSYNLCYGTVVMKPAPMRTERNGAKIKVGEDYYGPAAIFPHYWQGKLVGWQHRWMEWDEGHTKTPTWLGKYTNTGDFPKHETLFNYDRALKARQPVVVVESVPAALYLISNGWPAVSHFGGTPKPQQLRLLRRFSQGVILCPDNDKTGDSFVETTGEYLERFTPVQVADKVTLKPKADLGDYAAQTNGTARLNHHLTHQLNPFGVQL